MSNVLQSHCFLILLFGYTFCGELCYSMQFNAIHINSCMVHRPTRDRHCIPVSEAIGLWTMSTISFWWGKLALCTRCALPRGSKDMQATHTCSACWKLLLSLATTIVMQNVYASFFHSASICVNKNRQQHMTKPMPSKDAGFAEGQPRFSAATPCLRSGFHAAELANIGNHNYAIIPVLKKPKAKHRVKAQTSTIIVLIACDRMTKWSSIVRAQVVTNFVKTQIHYIKFRHFSEEELAYIIYIDSRPHWIVTMRDTGTTRWRSYFVLSYLFCLCMLSFGSGCPFQRDVQSNSRRPKCI